MRRHSAMEFAAGVDGVSRRRRRRPRPQRRHRLGRAAAGVVGAAVRHRSRPGRGAGLRRGAGDLRGIGGAVRRAGRRPGRHRRRDASVYRDPAARWPTGRCRSRTSCAGRTWCCVPTCCGRGRTGSPRKPSAPAATTPISLWQRCRRVSAPTARTPNPTAPAGRLPQDAIADFAAGRNVLLPPTWTQLDSLAGRTVADVLAVERQIVAGAAAAGEAGRQLGVRVLRLRPLPPGTQGGRLDGMAGL